MDNNYLGWACLGIYIIVDITKHIITIISKLLYDYFEKKEK